MSSVPFSYTDHYIIDPISVWRTRGARNQCILEVITRVIALFTSIFAAIDALIQIAKGMYKGGCHLATKSYSKADVCNHFKQAAFFAKLTVIGSILGIVRPDCLKQYRSSILLLQKDAGKEIPVPVGQPFYIQLGENYFCSKWKISKIPTFINHLSKYINPVYPPDACGGSPDYGFVFEAEEPGKGAIVMKLPCQFDKRRTREYTFTIVAR